MSANDVMEHFAFPGNIDFAADDQGAFFCVYSSSVNESLPSVNHEQFPMQMSDRHNKWLQILAQEDFQRNSSERERRLQKQRRRSREQETEESREPTSFPGSLSHLNEVAEKIGRASCRERV